VTALIAKTETQFKPDRKILYNKRYELDDSQGTGILDLIAEA